eukprot:CAMPEP_0201535946 /NCGR_PEP_ID=MMETSP0161_2-20130828/60475_1 /ASSEMBLY_ACC=CAM_ASM_000251 /TAXON_ID=180227 /ORGANISM="Neoparamoeba aestuarina, Strain SoJaBio B1-5/56/2" /LENGTH=264 /DNA_ID=CAMNT_0047941373 /DNA_START=174 /DNA_END=968 /DNA_ORIENTATION=+
MKAELRQYAMDFEKAIYAFLHHLVYDTQTQTIVHFTPLGMKSHRQALIGEIFDMKIARAICEDITVDPITLTPYSQGSDARKLTDFFDVSRSQQRRHDFSKHQKNHKRSLKEILEAQEKKKPGSIECTELFSRTKVVSRFFSSKKIGLSPMIDSLSHSCEVVTDDPARSLPSTQQSPAEPSSLLQTPVISMNSDRKDRVTSDIGKCIDRTVRKIAHVVERYKSSHSPRGNNTLLTRSVDQVAKVIEDNIIVIEDVENDEHSSSV